MNYFILAVIIFGIGGFIVMAISGAFIINKEKKLNSLAVARGHEYGIYYELSNGEDAFCFIHKDPYKAEKCINQLRKEGNYSQVLDWEGRDYSFTIDSFQKAIGEEIDRQKFKIIKRSLRYSDNKNLPKLNLDGRFNPKLIRE
jgi:hypothetical protein